MKTKAYVCLDLYEKPQVRVRKNFETYREFEAFMLGFLEQNKHRKEDF